VDDDHADTDRDDSGAGRSSGFSSISDVASGGEHTVSHSQSVESDKKSKTSVRKMPKRKAAAKSMKTSKRKKETDESSVEDVKPMRKAMKKSKK